MSVLTLLHSESPKLHTISAFLSATGLKEAELFKKCQRNNILTECQVKEACLLKIANITHITAAVPISFAGVMRCIIMFIIPEGFISVYSRTSVARTLMARLPRLFRTRS